MRKNYKHSKETRLKMSLAKKGKTSPFKGMVNRYSKKTLDHWSLVRKGRKQHSEEYKKKLSERMKGNKYVLGRKMDQEERKRRLQNRCRGERNNKWKGGITPLNEKIRKSLEYKLWCKAVFERDNYTCMWCGNKESGNLNADHIKPFCIFPELRFAIDNGRTLCRECHRKTDTYGTKALDYKNSL